MTINHATQNGDFAGEQGPEFAAMREAYEAARDSLAQLIDYPDKSIPVFDYVTNLGAAKRAVRAAHNAMLGAWTVSAA